MTTSPSLSTLLAHSVRMDRRSLPRDNDALGPTSAIEGALLALVAHQPYGVLVLARSGLLEFASSVARRMLNGRTDLAIRRQTLTTTDAALATMLRRDRSATGTRAAWTTTLGGAADPLLVHRPALRRRADPSMLVLYSPRRRPDIPELLLQHLYGLTASESQLAVALACGDDLSTAAARLRVSIHTVRTHLKKIFAKLDVSSQAALVRLVLLGPLRSD